MSIVNTMKALAALGVGARRPVIQFFEKTPAYYVNDDVFAGTDALVYNGGQIVSTNSAGAVVTGTLPGMTQSGGAGTIGTGQARIMVLTSTGYLFCSSVVSNAADPGQGRLMRSIDGGKTWQAVYTLPNGSTKSATAPGSLVEAEDGTLFCHLYPGTDAKVLIKSTDKGATWTDITASLPLQPASHVHSLYYCPWRKLLFLAHGDAGTLSKVQVSADKGGTWDLWQASVQTTSITSDSRFIYLGLDNGWDRTIMRSNCPAWINPAKQNCPVERVWSGPLRNAGDGFPWVSYADDRGIVWFIFGSEGPSRIIASQEYGRSGSWFTIFDGSPAPGNSGTNFFSFYPNGPTRYAEGLFDGLRYGIHPVTKKLTGWVVGRSDDVISIDPIAGSNSYDGILRPRAYATGEEVLPVVQQAFVATAAANTVSTAGADQATPTWAAETSGSMVVTTAVQLPTSSKVGARFSGAGKGYLGNKAIMTGAEGMSHWLAGTVLLDMAQYPTEDTIIAALRGEWSTPQGVYFQLVVTPSGKLKVVFYDGANSPSRSWTLPFVMPLGKEQRIKLNLVQSSAGKGALRAWAGSSLIFDLSGVNTVAVPSTPVTPFIGAKTATAPVSVMWATALYQRAADPG